MFINRLRELFAQNKDEPVPDNGPVTVADILKHGWLELFYQPKIELKSKRLVGAEGLMRARHPVRGIISPGEFLPSASEADILALTERVIVTALMDWKAWAEVGMPLKLSVNVPVSVLTKLPIPAILREHRPRATNWPGLIMEVTEDEILHDLKIANDVAGALREFNCTLALDDFGAGYSSLARLRQLPFSELKIDRSYVTSCHVDRVNAGLCETIVELAQRFGLTSVAEGIETVHESHKLQAIGCQIGQGYLFAKPMPQAQLIGTIRRRMTGHSTSNRHHKSVA